MTKSGVHGRLWALAACVVGCAFACGGKTTKDSGPRMLGDADASATPSRGGSEAGAGNDASPTPDAADASASPADSGAEGGAGGYEFVSGLRGCGTGGGVGGPEPCYRYCSLNDGPDANRAIADADVVEVLGTRLYALSRRSGLSVVDVSGPDELRVLGRLRFDTMPHEMHLRDSTALVLLDESVVAVDVSDPSSLRVSDEFAFVPHFYLPRREWRLVGDVLYVVGDEVVALDVSTPAAMRELDRHPTNRVTGSLLLTDERIYVGADASVSLENFTVQVFDISDPSGAIVEGGTVSATGEYGQMDEHDGVLRVLRVPIYAYRTIDALAIDTFTVTSETELIPLGHGDTPLSRSMQIRSWHFDGPRAYLIGDDPADVLLLIDLSDPENPSLAGELEIPGGAQHVEPLGDRVLVFGTHNYGGGGKLHASLFDVSDLEQPQLLDRVEYGTVLFTTDEYGYQHKSRFSFAMLDDLSLAASTYWGQNADSWSGCDYVGGVQLVQFTRDTLTLRGSAPHRGAARRIFTHNGQLISVSDENVQAFDISDRDAPQRRSRATIAHQVRETMAVDETHLVRLGQDWWTEEEYLDVTTLDRAEELSPLGSLNLSDALRQGDAEACTSVYRIFDHGPWLYVLFQRDGQRRLGVVDVSAASSPRVVSTTWLDLDSWQDALAVGSTIVVSEEDGTLIVIDASQPESPRQTATVELPSRDTAAHWRPATEPLRVAGTLVYTSHSTPVEGSALRPYFLDRIDVQDPSHPEVLPSVNIPGSVIAYDPVSQHALVEDYQVELTPTSSPEECPVPLCNEPDAGQCAVPDETLFRLVAIEGDRARVLDSSTLGGSGWVVQAEVARNNVHLFYGRTIDSPHRERPMTVYDLASSTLETRPASDEWRELPALAASADHLAVWSDYCSEVELIHVPQDSDPEVIRSERVAPCSWGAAHVELTPEHAVISLGEFGVRVWPLTGE